MDQEVINVPGDVVADGNVMHLPDEEDVRPRSAMACLLRPGVVAVPSRYSRLFLST